mmetsp:Transcript_58870/g.139071  ORF Transcript_58870/g.139071 Transcript_58870/m.139071 type:complete len:223 (+) Transcript_58870:213-881(+)
MFRSLWRGHHGVTSEKRSQLCLASLARMLSARQLTRFGFEVDEFHVEAERRRGRDRRGAPAGAVGMLVLARENSPLAAFHRHERDVPALNHLALSGGELEGRPSRVARGVELGSVEKGSRVVSLDLVALLRRIAGALDQHLLDGLSVGGEALLLGALQLLFQLHPLRLRLDSSRSLLRLLRLLPHSLGVLDLLEARFDLLLPALLHRRHPLRQKLEDLLLRD